MTTVSTSVVTLDIFVVSHFDRWGQNDFIIHDIQSQQEEQRTIE